LVFFWELEINLEKQLLILQEAKDTYNNWGKGDLADFLNYLWGDSSHTLIIDFLRTYPYYDIKFLFSETTYYTHRNPGAVIQTSSFPDFDEAVGQAFDDLEFGLKSLQKKQHFWFFLTHSSITLFTLIYSII